MVTLPLSPVWPKRKTKPERQPGSQDIPKSNTVILLTFNGFITTPPCSDLLQTTMLLISLLVLASQDEPQYKGEETSKEGEGCAYTHSFCLGVSKLLRGCSSSWFGYDLLVYLGSSDLLNTLVPSKGPHWPMTCRSTMPIPIDQSS